MKSNELNWRFQRRHAGPPYRIRTEQCVYVCVPVFSKYDHMTTDSWCMSSCAQYAFHIICICLCNVCVFFMWAGVCVCVCLHYRLCVLAVLVSCDQVKYSRQNQDSQPAVIPQDNTHNTQIHTHKHTHTHTMLQQQNNKHSGFTNTFSHRTFSFCCGAFKYD